MSIFGKLKSFGASASPKRIENNAGYGWPDDEFDDEDTYEAPPCERPTVKVPPRPVEENVYLGLTSNPSIPQRQAPLSRPAKIAPMKQQQQQQQPQDTEEFYIDPNSAKPPEVHRHEKPGKKQAPRKPVPKPGPLPVRSAPAPAPPAHFEEDVYLDPNEDQGDSDDVYLEPEAACPPPVRGPMRIPSKPAADPPSRPMMKPPVPRAKSSALLVSEERPGMDARRCTLPGKLPPLSLVSQHAFLAGLKEPKPSPPLPPNKDTNSAGSPTGLKAGMAAGREDNDWFAGNCDRKTAEERLLRINKDGAFLVRHSKTQSPSQPYTLAVLYREKVYNIPVRYLEETHTFALGKEGKKNEEFFSSLRDIISHHKNNQLLLIDSKSQAKHTIYLTHPACC